MSHRGPSGDDPPPVEGKTGGRRMESGLARETEDTNAIPRGVLTEAGASGGGKAASKAKPKGRKTPAGNRFSAALALGVAQEASDIAQRFGGRSRNGRKPDTPAGPAQLPPPPLPLFSDRVCGESPSDTPGPDKALGLEAANAESTAAPLPDPHPDDPPEADTARRQSVAAFLRGHVDPADAGTSGRDPADEVIADSPAAPTGQDIGRAAPDRSSDDADPAVRMEDTGIGTIGHNRTDGDDSVVTEGLAGGIGTTPFVPSRAPAWTASLDMSNREVAGRPDSGDEGGIAIAATADGTGMDGPVSSPSRHRSRLGLAGVEPMPMDPRPPDPRVGPGETVTTENDAGDKEPEPFLFGLPSRIDDMESIGPVDSLNDGAPIGNNPVAAPDMADREARVADPNGDVLDEREPGGAAPPSDRPRAEISLSDRPAALAVGAPDIATRVAPATLADATNRSRAETAPDAPWGTAVVASLVRPLDSGLGLVQRWPLTVLGPGLGVALLVAGALQIPTPLYIATAALMIEVVPGTSASDIDARLAEVAAALRSPTLAARAIADLKLYDQPEFNPMIDAPAGRDGTGDPRHDDPARLPEQIYTDERMAVIDRFIDRLAVSPRDDAPVIDLSVSAWSPEAAARITNRVAALYLDQRVEAATRDAERLGSALAGRLRDVDERLNTTESDVAALRAAGSNDGTVALAVEHLQQRLAALSDLRQAVMDQRRALTEIRTAPGARVLARAEAPVETSFPPLWWPPVLALLFGLAAGFGTALLRDSRGWNRTGAYDDGQPTPDDDPPVEPVVRS